METIAANMMKMNGNAAAIDMVCSGFKPPAMSRPIAMAVSTMPHKIFLPFDGFTLPALESMPNTNVPGLVGGFAGERVLRAPADGVFTGVRRIGAGWQWK